ncbi:type I 3-dehydroquinate dehydratase [Salinicoccus hispanicus]|uniref:3-dehydroquinate dehydratase n=1 Tax=Salinicoccus hispanicus TaxID=157225 RepID=A0A6N8TYW8_9STAP|nr:type I 3-dehydroquinate dehydratase [Salinicoccus hispanicus]MXQ50773.1 type I 3-dehydroquinate dehydratase [Salinicoccus hispanicus]
MNVKGVDIGSGQPKVVVSFSNHSKETVDEEIKGVLDNPSAVDIVEIRSDAFDALSHEAHLELVNHIIDKLEDYPILYTYRTQSEGGKGQKTAVEYESLLNSVLDQCDIQLIDIEFFMYEDIVDALVEKAKRKGILVVLSQHDFRDTPDFDEIMATYKDMHERGGDILKLAYNPADGRDVLSILTAVHDARQQLKCQVVGISMGELGKITRVAGGVFGSCLTYGYISHKAAPGQFHVQDLKNNLQIFE